MSFNSSTLHLNKIIITDNYEATDNDFSVICDPTTNNITVTLPDSREVVNQVFSVCVMNLHHMVVVKSVFGLINHLPTFTFNGTPYRSIIVQSIGTKYVVLSSHDVEYYYVATNDDTVEDEII